MTTLASVEEDAVIVRSTIDLAHNLSLNVVAEGVEDEETLNLLIELRMRRGPGLLLQPSASAGDLVPWLNSSSFGLVPRLGTLSAVGSPQAA